MIELLLQAERLLLHGRLDEAERIYAQTVAADPNNAIAVVGLARVALERGDDRLAYGSCCRALEIDPQNIAALRLEARLSEVLSTRGEPVERPAWIIASAATTKPALSAPSVAGPPATANPSSVEAERASFARNPSMADHRRHMEQPASPRHDEENGRDPTAQAARPEPRRRSVIARLLGRR